MNQKTITLVQDSFQKVIPIADQAMVIFYDQLFKVNPSLTALFPSDPNRMGQQRNKLRDMLVVAVARLSDLDKLVPVLQNLGRRHNDYGVTADHYQDVGTALLNTLEIGLGEQFTPEVKQAWEDIYSLMANTMIEAASVSVSV